MAPRIRQTVGRSVSTGHRVCKVTLTNPTTPGNLIYVTGVVVHSGSTNPRITGPSGYTLIRQVTANEITMAVWYRQAAPTTSEISISADNGRSIQLRVVEYEGAAQANALDRVSVQYRSRYSDEAYTGSTGNTSQGDEIVVAAVCNRYASTRQSGFYGGLTRLIEQVSPSDDPDDYRSRLTLHNRFASFIASFFLYAFLTSARDWIAILCTFRGGSTGPARFTTSGGQALTVSGRSSLTAFGPLKTTQAAPALRVSSSRSRMGPFDYQYRINGWEGLLIGSGTRFHVEGTEGLYGWQIRTSDDDLPREDGALRGIDLVSARQILFNMNVGRGREEVERNMNELYNALVPQRDEDWELIWRHPGQPLKLLRCRPIDLMRERNARQILFSKQSFVLRAADPRHYAAIPKIVEIPVSLDNDNPSYIVVRNEGNSPAYPLITVIGENPEPITRVELVNFNGLHLFDVRLTLPERGVLVGDMEARVTGVARPIITLDGQTKYGAWQQPREPFRLEPAPILELGDNVIYLRTEPEGANVRCILEYRDTWAG